MRISASPSDTSHKRRSLGSLDMMPDCSVGLMIERLFGVLTRAPCGGPKECPHFTSPDNGRKIEGMPCLSEGAQPRPLVRESSQSIGLARLVLWTICWLVARPVFPPRQSGSTLFRFRNAYRTFVTSQVYGGQVVCSLALERSGYDRVLSKVAVPPRQADFRVWVRDVPSGCAIQFLDKGSQDCSSA
jgi:hypothetical protein